MSNTINGGAPRTTAAAQTQTAGAGNEQAQADLAELRQIQKDIEAIPAKDLTAEDRSSYGQARYTEKLLESSTFIGMLGKSVHEKITKKMDSAIQGYLAQNPNASPADIKAFVDSTFKKELGSATASKFVVDMAINQMKARLDELQEDGFDK